MKRYPSIERSFMKFDAYVFDKIDGSNLRFEWTKVNGWNKFGTRRRLFDESDPDFGMTIQLFMDEYEPQLRPIIVKQKWQKVIAFFEFAGEKSFAGNHEVLEPKTLTLIDFSIHKRGILGPKEYLKIFGDLSFSAKFLGRFKWDKKFLDNIKNSRIDGITFEGVVGKAVIKNRLVMRKAKTQQWLDRVKEKYDPKIAERIINS